METENKEIKIEAENSCRNTEVKVTNLVSEIRTTDLPRESPIQVDRKEERDTNSNGEGKQINGDKKIAEGNDKVVKDDNGDKKLDQEEKNVEEVEKVDNGNKKADESKRVDNEDKKADESKKVDNGDKKTDVSKNQENGDKKTNDSKKAEKDGKKTDDSKKADNGNKKEDVSKKVEKERKKVEESKKVGKKPHDDKKIDAGNNSLGKSSKQEKVSPLAAYFKDWDKFTVYQKIDIEKLIIKKAEEMGAPSKTKPGVRTYNEENRMRFRWSAIRRRRQSRRFKESLGLEGSRSLQDRRSPIRIRGSRDSRSRYPGDNRRFGYSPSREAPWRSPWSSQGSMPVENLIKQMERFVQMVDKFPKPIPREVPGNMIHEGLKIPLLPTPPHGYDFALRGNNGPTENNPRDYMGNNLSSPQRWSVQQFTVNGEEPSRRVFGKEPSSKSLPKPRSSPYGNQSSYCSTTQRKDNWSSRDRGYSKNTGIQPPTSYKESRYNYGTTYRR